MNTLVYRIILPDKSAVQLSGFDCTSVFMNTREKGKTRSAERDCKKEAYWSIQGWRKLVARDKSGDEINPSHWFIHSGSWRWLVGQTSELHQVHVTVLVSQWCALLGAAWYLLISTIRTLSPRSQRSQSSLGAHVSEDKRSGKSQVTEVKDVAQVKEAIGHRSLRSQLYKNSEQVIPAKIVIHACKRS